MPVKPKTATTTSHKSQQFKLKPFDQIAQQTHPKSSLNLKFYLNSACFNVDLSDTLFNVYRDINFDSCTLCVCNNNNIYGLDHSVYILNDILNAGELNQLSSSIRNMQDEASSEQKQQASSQNMQTTPNQSLLLGNANVNAATANHCTCGFSSLVNRSILSKNAMAISLDVLVKLVARLGGDKAADNADASVIMPYANLVRYLNKQTNPLKRDQQLYILNSTQCSGLFLEDYMEILNVCQPHYLLSKLNAIVRAATNNKPVSSSVIARKLVSNVVTSKFLNSILMRENYAWKKSFVYKAKSSPTNALVGGKKSAVASGEASQSANMTAGSQGLAKDSNKVD